MQSPVLHHLEFIFLRDELLLIVGHLQERLHLCCCWCCLFVGVVVFLGCLFVGVVCWCCLLVLSFVGVVCLLVLLFVGIVCLLVLFHTFVNSFHHAQLRSLR